MASDRALVVDDNDETREFVALLLRSEGWEAMAAPDGTNAMAKFWGAVDARRPFRLVMMDLMMPGMDGFSTAERMRRIERERGMPRAYILGFTAYSEYTLSEEALKRAEFDSLMIKPVHPDELRAAFAEAKRHG